MPPLEDVHRYATEVLVPEQFVSIGTEGCVFLSGICSLQISAD